MIASNVYDGKGNNANKLRIDEVKTTEIYSMAAMAIATSAAPPTCLLLKLDAAPI
jgi:hypothetical protein